MTPLGGLLRPLWALCTDGDLWSLVGSVVRLSGRWAFDSILLPPSGAASGAGASASEVGEMSHWSRLSGIGTLSGLGWSGLG